jgi:hypothetical protein
MREYLFGITEWNRSNVRTLGTCCSKVQQFNGLYDAEALRTPRKLRHLEGYNSDHKPLLKNKWRLEQWWPVPDLGQMKPCASYVMMPLTWALKEVDPVDLHRQSTLSLCLDPLRNITPSNLKLHHISKNPSFLAGWCPPPPGQRGPVLKHT